MRQRMVLAWAVAGVWAVAGSAAATAETNAAEEVVVTATRTEKSLHDVPGSVEVVDATAIEEVNPMSVDELFKSMPGVDLQGSGYPGSAVRLNLRGLTPGYQSERLLVLADGRRINDPYMGNVEFSLQPADGIERVEVLRGPASALYGSSAVGGVVELISRRGQPEPRTSLAVSGGEHNTWRSAASHGWKIGDVDYFVAGSHVETDGYLDNSDGTDRDWRADNVAGNVGWGLGEDSSLRAFLGAYQADGTDESSERDVRKDYQMLVFTHGWQGESDPRLEARAYRNGERQEYAWKYAPAGVYDLETLGGEIQHSMRVGASHRATVGAEAREDRADIEESTGSVDESTDVEGVYAQDEIRLAEDWQLTVGLRQDCNTDYGTEWSPRAGLLWRIAESAEAFASVNRAHRAPSLSDRFVQVEYNGVLFEGNPDLDPESLTAWEVGARARLTERAQSSLALFYNRLSDSFDFLLDSDGVFRNYNVTESSVYGAEAEVRVELTGRLSAFANYTFTEGEYDEFPSQPDVEGNRLAYLARDKAAAGLQYEDARGSRHTVSGRFAGERYGDAQNTEDARMDSYVVVDWRSRVPVAAHTCLTLNVDNVCDESYREFPTYDQPGRTVMAGAEVTF